MLDPSLRIEDRGPARWVLLDRPQRHNAIDLPTARAWAEALRAASADPSVRAVVLAGEGPSFCSGGDLRAFSEAEDRRTYLSAVASAMGDGVRAIVDMPKAVVAAVHGAAMGVGFSLLLAADYKLVARGTRLAMSYINVGLTPGGGGTWLLSRLVGVSRAHEMLLMGEPITADEALAIGIANRVVEPDVLREEAQATAERFAEQAPTTMARTKALLWRGQADGLSGHLDLEAETIGMAAEGPEFEEGAQAFFQRRRPKF